MADGTYRRPVGSPGAAPLPQGTPQDEDVESPEMRELKYQRITKPQQDRARATADAATPKSFKRGGTVKRTGVYKLHAGERVLSVKQRKKFKI